MDNAAFRSLISSTGNGNGGGRGGGGGKRVGGIDKSKAPVQSTQLTTKEIARKAVEDEFEQRKKRRRGLLGRSNNPDYYSDDDDGDNRRLVSNRNGRSNVAEFSSDEEAGLYESATRKEDNEQDVPRWKKERREKRKEQQQGPQYRDRAKERRLGLLNPDYKASSKLDEAAKQVDAEMSKYLGGDEQHTHLVKGLDFSLARKEKEKILAKEKGIPYCESLNASAQQNDNKGLLKGTFDEINMDDLDRLREEASKQKKAHHAEQKTHYGKACDDSITGESKESAKSVDTTERKRRKKERKRKHKKEKKRRKKEKKKTKKKGKYKETEADKSESDSCINDGNASDSSEDIFAVSGDYVPPDKALAKVKEKESTSKSVSILNQSEAAQGKKPSIFEETGRNEEDTIFGSDDNIDSLDKNALIAKLVQRGQLNTNSTTENHGIRGSTDTGLSSYQGGYGEEMDLDFDGTMEQEVHEAKQMSRIRAHGRDGKNARSKDKAQPTT